MARKNIYEYSGGVCGPIAYFNMTGGHTHVQLSGLFLTIQYTAFPFQGTCLLVLCHFRGLSTRNFPQAANTLYVDPSCFIALAKICTIDTICIKNFYVMLQEKKLQCKFQIKIRIENVKWQYVTSSKKFIFFSSPYLPIPPILLLSP